MRTCAPGQPTLARAGSSSAASMRAHKRLTSTLHSAHSAAKKLHRMAEQSWAGRRALEAHGQRASSSLTSSMHATCAPRRRARPRPRPGLPAAASAAPGAGPAAAGPLAAQPPRWSAKISSCSSLSHAEQAEESSYASSSAAAHTPRGRPHCKRACAEAKSRRHANLPAPPMACFTWYGLSRSGSRAARRTEACTTYWTHAGLVESEGLWYCDALLYHLPVKQATGPQDHACAVTLRERGR